MADVFQALSILLLAWVVFSMGKILREQRKDLRFLRYMSFRIKQRLAAFPISHLPTLVLGKTVGQGLQQGQVEECIFSCQALEQISNGVCVCLSQDQFGLLDQGVRHMIHEPLNMHCNVFRIEAIGEGKPYYLVFNKSNDELNGFLTSKGVAFDITRSEI